MILSASGMASAAACCTTWPEYLGDHRNVIVLTGYQAPGTRGPPWPGGSKSLRMHGQDLRYGRRSMQLTAASTHADGNQLLDWLRAMPSKPGQVFVTHGDPDASDQLRHRIECELLWPAMVPEHLAAPGPA
ncbi:MAG: MBL fold metallo-hydrolase RNA specificity domain-containing protein [Burkholderiaceae bacterium]